MNSEPIIEVLTPLEDQMIDQAIHRTYEYWSGLELPSIVFLSTTGITHSLYASDTPIILIQKDIFGNQKRLDQCLIQECYNLGNRHLFRTPEQMPIGDDGIHYAATRYAWYNEQIEALGSLAALDYTINNNYSLDEHDIALMSYTEGEVSHLFHILNVDSTQPDTPPNVYYQRYIDAYTYYT
jgi:hypothetical protein